MSQEELPGPVVAYIQAKQDHDTEALLGILEENALIVDAGKEYRGLEAIRHWCGETDIEHRVTYEVGDVEYMDNQINVKIELSGDALENPVLLTLYFTIHKGKISRILVDS